MSHLGLQISKQKEKKMTITAHQNHEDGSSRSSGATREHLNKIADEAAATLEDAKHQSAEHYEHLRDIATGQIDSLAEGAKSAASALQGSDSLGLSRYLGQLADGLGSFANQVREKSAEDLLHQSAKFARDNPVLFLAGSVAIGFGLSRFLRASTPGGVDSATKTSEQRNVEPARTSVDPVPTDHSVQSSAETPTSVNVDDPLGGSATYPSSTDQLRGGE
jgi:hypothetical protein